MKITGLDLVISDACSCLTVLGSSSAVQGKGEAKGRKEEEGVGRKHGQGHGGLCSAGRGARGAAREWSSLQKTRSSKLAARLRFDSGSHSLLSYCTCVARRSLIYVSLAWAQSRDGDGSARGEECGRAPQCRRGRLVPSVWVRWGCGVPAVTGGTLALPSAGRTLRSERTWALA